MHFVSDTPPETVIEALREAYLAQDGALMPLYEILLTHPIPPRILARRSASRSIISRRGCGRWGLRGEALMDMPIKSFAR